MDAIVKLDRQALNIGFKAIGIYSKPVEAFSKDYGYAYCRMNLLEAILQMATIHRHKTDQSDTNELAKTQFKMGQKRIHIQDDYIWIEASAYTLLWWNRWRYDFTKGPYACNFKCCPALSTPEFLLIHFKVVIKNRLKANTWKIVI